MATTIDPPSPNLVGRINRAASIAAVQLEEAQEVVKVKMPELTADQNATVVAAVVQAIAANFHALSVAPPKT